jgi:hypothetical protein
MEKDPDSEVKICSEWPRSTNRSSSLSGNRTAQRRPPDRADHRTILDTEAEVTGLCASSRGVRRDGCARRKPRLS